MGKRYWVDILSANISVTTTWKNITHPPPPITSSPFVSIYYAFCWIRLQFVTISVYQDTNILDWCAIQKLGIYSHMQTLNLIWHDVLIFLSFIACIAGLLLLSDTKQTQADELEETEQILFRMSFSYWMVYCIAVGIQKIALPDWEILLLSLKLTAALSYFLTFACIVCLPLHRFAVRQVQE